MAEFIVTHEREARVTTRLMGRERRGASRPTQTEVQVREQITSIARDQVALARHKPRLGWRVQVTNLAQVRMPLAQSILIFQFDRSQHRHVRDISAHPARRRR
jgi:hypothetical protein